MDMRIASTEEILKENKGWSYERTDRNGTRYFRNHICERCGGSGYMECYNMIEGGVCFACGGTGHSEMGSLIKIMLPEYEEKLNARRLARQQKLVEDKRKNRGTYLEKAGFGHEDDEYVIYRVVGNTYPIKDELKEAGAKFNPTVGWFFSCDNENYRTQRMTEAQVLNTECVEVSWKEKDEVSPLYTENVEAVPSTSEWMGEVGDKIEFEVKIDRCITGEGFRGKPNYFYLMSDESGNIFKWSTSCCQYQVGETYRLRGTIKSLDEYKGTKQTCMTRCTQVK